jgi:beta-lactamase regulating signal transducer with metallopeptidase domain
MTESLRMIAPIASTALISSIWQGALLTAMVWLCLKLAPRASAGLRFGIWSAVFAVTAILPLFTIFAGHAGAVPAVTMAPTQTQSSAPIVLLDSRWALGIAAIWAIVALGRLLLLARNAFKVHALWRSSTTIELTPDLQLILAQPGLRSAALCASDQIDQPCVIGFLSPRILVPAWLLESATPSELEQIVLHESAHLRRFDDWTNLAQKLALACFPLNPAFLWIERRLCAEREVACDESVVRATNAPRDYATCLTNLAEQRHARRTLALSSALSLGAWERRSQLASRIESILSGKTRLRPLQARALALALMLGTLSGGLKLASTAQLVSFASAQPGPPLARLNTQTNLAQANLAQTNHTISAGPHYENVVFHPASAPAIGDNQISATPVKHLAARPAVKTSLHRTNHPADGVESILIVTRWQNASGEQVTVINQIVRISALSAAQSQGGWFVVQL